MFSFLKGLGVGLSVAAIVGPIAILTIRRTLSEGQAVGLAIAFGAACGDVVFALIAGFGLTFIADFLKSHQIILRILGGLFLFYLGVTTFLEKPKEKSATIKAQGLANIAFGSFLLNMTNPVTIASFTAIFAGIGIGSDEVDYTAILLLVLGVFLGAMLWNIGLTTVLTHLRSKFTDRTLEYINKCSGALLMIFGLLSIVSLLIK